MTIPFPQPTKTGRFREGVGWKKEDLEAWIAIGGLHETVIVGGKTTGAQKNEGDYSMADVEQAYNDATEAVAKANVAYIKILDKFRSEIKNDLASISASADRVQKENAKIKLAYEATANTLTTPEMEKAIANAERLAAALKEISGLQNHSITFAVLDKKTQA